jgi:hypothetical protein
VHVQCAKPAVFGGTPSLTLAPHTTEPVAPPHRPTKALSMGRVRGMEPGHGGRVGCALSITAPPDGLIKVGTPNPPTYPSMLCYLRKRWQYRRANRGNSC